MSVPERGLGSGLAPISIATVPLPVPLVAPVSVSQESFEVAVHEHDVVVVTSVLLEPDAGPAEIVRGDTAYEQLGAAAAAWFTVTVWPAIVSVPERGDVSVFSAIENDTVALPVPLAALVSVSQDAFATAVHAHEDVVVMSTLLEPAAARADTFVDDSEIRARRRGSLVDRERLPGHRQRARARRRVGVGGHRELHGAVAGPDAPAVIDSHATLAVADHAQPAPSSRPPSPSSLDAPTDCEAADREYEHDADAAAWLTVNVWPATVSVPARGVGSVLAATENCTVPLPVPDAPAVIDSHETLAVADHAQPCSVVTFTEPVVLDAPTDCELADREYVHGVDDTPDWLTVNVWPAIVAVPVRAADDPFAATLISTVPSPAPLAPRGDREPRSVARRGPLAAAARQHRHRDRASGGADRLARRGQGERALRNRCAGRRLRERVDLPGDRHRARTLEAGVRRDVD